ncbi:hypothetical protein [Spirosoma aerophilum]
MLRVILDEQGSYTNDLFIKIDGSPSRAWVADTTWLGAFFDPADFSASDTSPVWSEEEIIAGKKADVALLIRLWQEMLLSDQPVCYLPFDLADQCAAALQITKRKKLYHITPVSTVEIVDGTSKTYYLQVQQNIIWRSTDNQALAWELASSSILTGLEWSLANLERPVISLKYD